MRILFVTNNMPFGGVERALIDNVKVLQALGHKVDLLLREKQGGFLGQLPSGVGVYELPLSSLDRYEIGHGRVPALKYMVKHGHWLYVARMVWMRLKWVVSGRHYNYDYEVVRSTVARTPRTLTTDYDLAIAYSADFAWSTIMTLNWVNASRKVSWCHMERCGNRMNHQLFADYYFRFDVHYACSQTTADRINQALGRPGLVRGFPHIVDTKVILAKAALEVDDARYSGSPIILTVGRVGEQKASDAAVRVCRKLKDSGFIGKWFWIGNGSEHDELVLRDQIEFEGVSDCFVFLGPKQNPYPYIKACDLYVQPSRYEGYCLTVAEARVLNRPIVATDFDGARDQLVDGVTGTIVPEENEESLLFAITSLLQDKEKRERYTRNLQMNNPDTQKMVKKAWCLLLEEVGGLP